MNLAPVRVERASFFRNNAAIGPFRTMIGIPLTAAAYEAIKGSLPGQRGSPPLRGPDGLIRIWLDCRVVDELGRLRGPGKGYSDVILRLGEAVNALGEQVPALRPPRAFKSVGRSNPPRAQL
jgi:hypothetical protein